MEKYCNRNIRVSSSRHKMNNSLSEDEQVKANKCRFSRRAVVETELIHNDFIPAARRMRADQLAYLMSSDVPQRTSYPGSISDSSRQPSLYHLQILAGTSVEPASTLHGDAAEATMDGLLFDVVTRTESIQE